MGWYTPEIKKQLEPIWKRGTGAATLNRSVINENTLRLVGVNIRDAPEQETHRKGDAPEEEMRQTADAPEEQTHRRSSTPTSEK